MTKRPIVMYSLSFFMGCLSFLFYINNVYLGAVLAASFLYIIFIKKEIIYFLIITSFFLTGFFRITTYFNYHPNGEERIRIIKANNNYIVGEARGRKLNITGEINELEEGRLILARGEFSKDINYKRGVIGSYNITKYKNLKEDLIYKFSNYKSNVIEKLSEYLDEDELSLVVSLCFGDVEGLHEIDKFKLQKLGVIHAVSVSGFHISIVYKFIEMLVGSGGALLCTLLYAIFTGLSYSTLRAFIMIFVLYLSKRVYKKYDGISSLSLAFILILLNKPYSFMEMGFALSFLATLGIILHDKQVKSFLKGLPKKLQDSLSITLSAQIFTLPYIAFTINSFSLGFLLGNIFLVPIFSFVVVLGNMSLFLIEFPILFKFLSYILYGFCNLIQYISYLLIRISPSMYYLGFYEGVYFMILYFSYIMVRKGRDKFKFLPLISFIVILFNIITIFPTINFINNEYVKGAIIRYNSECIMVCNYNLEQGKELTDIKDRYKVAKVITDIEKNFEINLKKYKANIIYGQEDILGIKFKKKNDTLFIPADKGDNTYRIIFGRIFRWRD